MATLLQAVGIFLGRKKLAIVKVNLKQCSGLYVLLYFMVHFTFKWHPSLHFLITWPPFQQQTDSFVNWTGFMECCQKSDSMAGPYCCSPGFLYYYFMESVGCFLAAGPYQISGIFCFLVIIILKSLSNIYEKCICGRSMVRLIDAYNELMLPKDLAMQTQDPVCGNVTNYAAGNALKRFLTLKIANLCQMACILHWLSYIYFSI